MFLESTPYLLNVYQNIDKVLLIFARVIGFIYLIPIFSGKNAPRQVKNGFAFFIAVALFSAGVGSEPIVINSAPEYVLIIAKEVLTGIIMSYVVYLFFTVFYFAGQMMDYSVGFSMVSVFDPVTQIQVPITGNLVYYAMAVLLITSGGLNSLFMVFFDSYKSIPIGGANFTLDQNFISFMLGLTASYLSIGLRIAMPIVGTIMLVDISLGILVKASPQMNVFVVGMPIKLLVGMTLLTIICPYFITVFHEVYATMIKGVEDIIGGMAYR